MHITHPATKEFQDPDFLKEVRARKTLKRNIIGVGDQASLTVLRKHQLFNPLKQEMAVPFQWVNFHLRARANKKNSEKQAP